ncbi:hypothetical protein O3G_MSEX003812 [Manduca sexta]|uniref:P94 n=1 Tax=Manduca sexta TaxID=7130 RepID=A0A921YTE0_MANSE|nr:hypothetical protein O3G_MSEX003812 [Manduca sexta]KAG6445273.1 hypothetical protein O3G_MSEX003812 [Manduca sexta]
MVNLFIYAKDFSSKTRGNEYYHYHGLKTIERFKNDVEEIEQELLKTENPPTESKVVYLHWGCKYEEVDEDIIRTTYLEQEGDHYVSCPKTIVYWLQDNYDFRNEEHKIKLLYIITDGMIHETCAKGSIELNSDMHYETVVFHAFNERRERIDLSVASSFFKSRCMVYCNYELYDSTDISVEFDYDKINADNFNSEKDNLKSYIKLKFLTKPKLHASTFKEIDKLKNLRNRLFDELLSETHKKHNQVNLETKDKSVLLREFVRTTWYKNLFTEAREATVEIEKCIVTLINYIVSDTKSFSFDALQFGMKFNKPVKEEEIVDVNFISEQEIAFPDIILEDDKGIPVVILTKLSLLAKIIFHENSSSGEVMPASFNKFKSMMECPLFLMNDKDISESIGYFYTLNVYKHFLENNINTEPRTRRPFHGGLVLIDTDEFDRYNDYILSATYFDSKKINFNIGLFYYVLWKNCENKEWMDKNVVTQFRKYAMRRISQTVCKIGLSSLPLDPRINTSLLTALWYCVELSSCIFKDDAQFFFQERLRKFYGVANYMLEILKYFNYELDYKSIERRIELVSHVMILKKIQKRKEKVYYLLETIFKTADGFLLSEIEKPFNLYKLNYLKLDHKDILRDDVVEETVHLNDYVHLMHFVGDLETSAAGKSTYEICDKTFRPFFTIDQTKSFYTELVKITKKVVISNDDNKDKVKVTYEPADSLEFTKVLSLYNLFIRCVINLGRYPSLPEYVNYISKRKKFQANLVTLFPSNFYHDILGVYSRYQKIVTKVEVSSFIQVSKSYVMRFERIKAEERVKFSSDDEINKFISAEESKVNLKKKVQNISYKRKQRKARS